MKNLLILIFFSLFANYVLGQTYPTPYQNLGSINVAVRDTGGLFIRGTFTVPKYVDTSVANAAPYVSLYPASLIFDSTNNLLWVRNATATKWISAGSGGSGAFGDTVYVRFPLGVDTTSIPGRQIIFIRSPNGLVSGGVVTKSDCWQVSITPAIYNLNYVQYTTLLTAVNIDTADATLPRIDYIIVDTFDVVSVLTGTPATTPLPPYVNPSSQLVLTRIDIPAGASCLSGITVKIVYDQNLGVGGGEFDATSSGTIDVDFDDVNNPYHLTKAAFVDTYTDGSKDIFTDTGNEDTVAAGEVLQQWIYLNNELFNQLQVQFWMNDTAVSNNVVINPFLNPLDSNEYQSVSVPFSAFSFSSNIFNKIVYTHAGDDTSGAKGYYIDYIQLQKGIINSGKQFVDSTTIIAGNLYDWYNGVPVLRGAVGGSGGTPNLQQVTDVGAITTNNIVLDDANLRWFDPVTGFYNTLQRFSTGAGAIGNVGTILPNGGGQLAISVNGNTADAAGNITLSVGSGTVTSFSAGTLSPLFTTSVATATTTPALTFALSNAAANTVYGNATSGSTAPSFGQIVNGQITNATIVATTKLSATGTPSASTYLRGDDTWAAFTNGTVTSVGLTAPSGFVVSNSPITTSGNIGLAWTGAVQGDLVYFSGSNAVAFLNKDANATRYLSNQGTSNNPSWNQVNLANGVTGTLPVANGGTSNTTFTAYSVITAGTTATGAFQNVSGVGTSGQVLTSTGAGALPTWQTPIAAITGVGNIGAGRRLVTTNGTNIKTLFTDLTATVDSTSNTDGITFKVDTSQIATQYDIGQIVDSLPIWNRRDSAVLIASTVGDQDNVYEPTVFREPGAQVLVGPAPTDTVYKMWYTDGWATSNICYAESLDGFTWTKYASNPIIASHARSFVIKSGSTYYIFASAGSAFTQIDRYTSTTGINPVLANSAVITTGSAGTWNATSVHSSHIIDSSGTWFMLLDGFRTGFNYSVGLYTSTNLGVTWTPYGSNPVLNGTSVLAGSTGLGLGSVTVQKIGQTYYCWALVAGTSGSVFLPTDIYKFSSPDLVNWTKIGMVFQRGTANEGWNTDVGQASDPFILPVGNKVYLYYAASANGGIQAGASRIKLAIAEQPISVLVTTKEGEGSSINPGNATGQVEVNFDNMHGGSRRFAWDRFVNKLYLGSLGTTHLSQIFSETSAATDRLIFMTGNAARTFIMGTDGVFTANGGITTALTVTANQYASVGSNPISITRANVAANSRITFFTTSPSTAYWFGHRGGTGSVYYFDGIGTNTRYWFGAGGVLGVSGTPDNSGSLLTIDGTLGGLTIPRVTTAQRDAIAIGATALNNLNLTAGGTGYTTGATVAFSGGSGSGATATATVTSNIVTALVLTAAGSGYVAGEQVTVTISPVGAGSGATATVQVGQSGTLVYNTDQKQLNSYNGANWTDFITSSAGTLTLKHGVDYIFTGTTTTWTLPAVSTKLLGSGNAISIKNRGSGAITLNSNAGSTIYTSAAVGTLTIPPGSSLALLPDGTYFNTQSLNNSGTYTPTLSNTTNVTSSTPIICHYTRTGNEITVTGSAGVVTTLAVATVLGISLPISSNLVATTDASGLAQASSAIATNAYIEGNTTTDIAELKFTGLSVGGSGNLFFTFTYTVL